MYEDGNPGEVFISMAKEGSTISGLMDSFATSISFAQRYGVPLKFLVDKFSHVRFEPSGWTGNRAHSVYAKSIMDLGDALVLKPTKPQPQSIPP